MAWVNRFDLSKYIIVGSNFGGPIGKLNFCIEGCIVVVCFRL